MRRLPATNSESDGQCDFNHHEEGFDDKTGQKDPVGRSVKDSDAQILDTNQDSADKVRDAITRISSSPVRKLPTSETHRNMIKNPSCI